MGFELNCGTLYMLEPNGNQIKFSDNISGLIEVDTLSANETPGMSYSLHKDLNTYLSASIEMSLQDLSLLYAPTWTPSETFNIEHNVPILTQAKWHKKKRINKKWLKRYGMKPDTVKMRASARTLSYNTETGDCEFEVDKLEYIWRADQKRKYLKIEM
jgi:hypothetical protein